MKYKYWFVALAHDKIDEYRDFLHKYIDASASYLIGLETTDVGHAETKGQHYHVACEISDQNYTTFRDAVHRKHFGLRGCNKHGTRQYGMVHNVRDETRMLAYTCKDKNVLSRHVNPEDIKKLILKSFPKKQDHRDTFRDVQKSLEIYYENNREFLEINNLPKELELEVIKIILKKELKDFSLTKSFIQRSVVFFLCNYIKDAEYIHSYFFRF